MDQSIRIRILVPLGFALVSLTILSVSGFHLHNRGRLEEQIQAQITSVEHLFKSSE